MFHRNRRAVVTGVLTVLTVVGAACGGGIPSTEAIEKSKDCGWLRDINQKAHAETADMAYEADDPDRLDKLTASPTIDEMKWLTVSMATATRRMQLDCHLYED